jgi:hypothetical protein
VLPRLQAKWVIPADVLESAAIVIDEKGQRREKVRKPSASPQPAAAVGNKTSGPA